MSAYSVMECPKCKNVYYPADFAPKLCPVCADAELAQLRIERDEMQDALTEAIDLAAEGISYTADYFVEKWGMDTTLVALKSVLAKYPMDEETK